MPPWSGRTRSLMDQSASVRASWVVWPPLWMYAAQTDPSSSSTA